MEFIHSIGIAAISVMLAVFQDRVFKTLKEDCL